MGDTDNQKSAKQLPASVPVVVIRDVVMFPQVALPLSVDREKSVSAIDFALKGDKYVLALTQKNHRLDDPKANEMFSFGVLSEISQSLKMPDGSIKVFLQGITRARVTGIAMDEAQGFWRAELEYPEETWEKTPDLVALMRQTLETFDNYVRLSRRIPAEAAAVLRQIDDPSRLADTIAFNIIGMPEDRQEILETIPPYERLEKILRILTNEIEILSLEEKIHSKVKTQIEKSQKEYYLNEQMKAIQKELNRKDDFQKDLEELRKKIKKNNLSEEAKAAAEKEIARLDKMAPFSPEATVSRTYLDWLLNLPWNHYTEDVLDIERARKIMDEDHFGLDKPKQRVLEYIAVSKLTKSLKGPILCFVGPPGVGKTSLARSIARAIGRKFVRVSLGGVRDESEIRGHRRTYIGSMPGRIIQSISKAKSSNPVFLLDEIDKMGMDWHGDPAAALLEVLDPEQNRDFVDHYLDVPFDISKVLFITTANSLEGIPYTLRDRLEILEYAGYTHDEKMSIVKEHLLPRQMKEHGLTDKMMDITPDGIERAITEYTREAGVRNLEREMGTVCRKAAKAYVEKKRKVSITKDNVPDFLGIPKFIHTCPEDNGVGITTGMAWTEQGGDLLAIEVVKFPGKGDVIMTGKLGNVMQESAKAALACIKARKLGGKTDYSKIDFHIHVPEGAVPKDGPSAGVTMATSLTSLLTGRPVRKGIAMTGELTITGRVLPIGGLKEKMLAAYREKVNTIIFPKGNEKDLEDVPLKVRQSIKLIPVTTLDEVLKAALGK